VDDIKEVDLIQYEGTIEDFKKLSIEFNEFIKNYEKV